MQQPVPSAAHPEHHLLLLAACRGSTLLPELKQVAEGLVCECDRLAGCCSWLNGSSCINQNNSVSNHRERATSMQSAATEHDKCSRVGAEPLTCCAAARHSYELLPPAERSCMEDTSAHWLHGCCSSMVAGARNSRRDRVAVPREQHCRCGDLQLCQGRYTSTNKRRLEIFPWLVYSTRKPRRDRAPDQGFALVAFFQLTIACFWLTRVLLQVACS